VVEGYRRRRAWAAFHAGYGTEGKQFEKPRIEHLMGRDPKPKMTSEQLLARFDAFAARHNARLQPPSND
jgi:hypothetical protein